MSVPEESARLRQAPDVVACSLESGNALLDLSSINYYSLNGSAAIIWEWIGSGTTISELVEQMLEAYDVDRETCVVDIQSIVASFEQAGLVVRGD